MDRREVLHLIGGVLALPALSGLTAAEAWALGRRLHHTINQGTQRGRVLDEHQLRTFAAIADRIIPATDTPGAAAAGVADFADLLLAEWYDDAERNRFLDGLTQVDARSRARGGRPFIELAEGEQDALLAEFDAEVQALRAAGRPVARHFFQQMKFITVHGYYTSEVGVTQELQWAAIPSGYDPCRAFVPRSAGGE